MNHLIMPKYHGCLENERKIRWKQSRDSFIYTKAIYRQFTNVTAFSVESEAGCPAGSGPLMDIFGQPQTCNPGVCPPTFMCHQSSMYGRWQCCSVTNFALPQIPAMSDPSECESGTVKIRDRCLKCMFLLFNKAKKTILFVTKFLSRNAFNIYGK